MNYSIKFPTTEYDASEGREVAVVLATGFSSS
jgi:hypothetical protein